MSVCFLNKTVSPAYRQITNNSLEPLTQAICQSLESVPLFEKLELDTELNPDNPKNATHLKMLWNYLVQDPTIKNLIWATHATVTYAESVRDAQLLQRSQQLESLATRCNMMLGVCTILEAHAATPDHSSRRLRIKVDDFDEQFAELHQ